ncbi:RES domain-containing protein [Spirosoma endophyticum]|uniref:RES domain-containing protein n=2 Tax=Spirosoma endophyticum TaxID=662367 RepID=A0A1I2HCJ6_9BACT|nr:RES domain-containing protein [Spirosoma endophyticum]
MCWGASNTVLSASYPATLMLTVYRTVKAKYIHEPLATERARLFGGRWNPKGYPLLYTTSSPALALVESLVHQPRVKYEKLPKLFLFTLEVPDDSLTTWSPEALPAYWNEESYERTQWILRDWLNEPTTLMVAVPSVVVPMSYNYLLHPAHSAFSQIRFLHQEPFPIERRL